MQRYQDDRPHVVVWDPEGEVNPGTVYDGRRAMVAIRARRMALLPIEPALIGVTGCSGFVVRHFGEGLVMDSKHNTRAGRISLYGMRIHQLPEIHWCARLVPAGDQPWGRLMLASDTGQVGALHATVGRPDPPIAIEKLDAPDPHGGWTVGGHVDLNYEGGGLIGMSLYGRLRHVRVLWLAVAQVGRSAVPFEG